MVFNALGVELKDFWRNPAYNSGNSKQVHQHESDQFHMGLIKCQAPGKLTGCERDLAINLPSCFRLIFLLSFIRKTKNVRLKKPTDLPYSNLVKPLIQTGLFYSNTSVNELHFWADDFLMNLKTWVSGEVSQVGKIWELLAQRASWNSNICQVLNH